MAYNCDSIHIVASEGFSISRGRLVALRREVAEYGVHPPESSILDEGDGPAEEIVSVKRLGWRGELSGSSWDAFCDVVLPAFSGSADLVCCWAGGDSYSGLRLRNGVVTKHRVVMALGEAAAE